MILEWSQIESKCTFSFKLFIFSHSSRHYIRRSTSEVYDTFKGHWNAFSDSLSLYFLVSFAMGCVSSLHCPSCMCLGFLSPACAVPIYLCHSGRDFHWQPLSYVMPKLPQPHGLFTGKAWGTAWGTQLCLNCWVWAAMEGGLDLSSTLPLYGRALLQTWWVVWAKCMAPCPAQLPPCVIYPELVPQDWVLADKTAWNPPKKGPCLSWGKDTWNLWLSWAQAELCLNCQCREM